MGDSQWWKHFFVMDGTEGEMKFWESEEHFKEMRKPEGEIEHSCSTLGGEHLDPALPPRTPLSSYSRVGRLLSSWNAAFYGANSLTLERRRARSLKIGDR